MYNSPLLINSSMAAGTYICLTPPPRNETNSLTPLLLLAIFVNKFVNSCSEYGPGISIGLFRTKSLGISENKSIILSLPIIFNISFLSSSLVPIYES